MASRIRSDQSTGRQQHYTTQHTAEEDGFDRSCGARRGGVAPDRIALLGNETAAEAFPSGGFEEAEVICLRH